YQGTVASGTVSVGARLLVEPSGEEVRVSRIVTFDGDLASAQDGDAVTLVFDRNVDAARGDMLVHEGALPLIGTSFRATVVALQSEGLVHGARVWLKAAGRYKRVRIVIDDIYDLAEAAWKKA